MHETKGHPTASLPPLTLQLRWKAEWLIPSHIVRNALHHQLHASVAVDARQGSITGPKFVAAAYLKGIETQVAGNDVHLDFSGEMILGAAGRSDRPRQGSIGVNRTCPHPDIRDPVHARGHLHLAAALPSGFFPMGALLHRYVHIAGYQGAVVLHARFND